VIQLNWANDSLPSLSAGTLTLVNGTNAGDWTLKAGAVNLLNVQSDGTGQYTLTMYKSDNTTSVHTVSSIEYLALPQLQALKSSLTGSSMLGAESTLTLKLKSQIYTATFDKALGLQTSTQTVPSSQTITTHDNSLLLSGRADVGAVVEVYDGVRLLGIATREGVNWSYDTHSLVEKPYRFTIKVRDDAGNSTTVAQTLTVGYNYPAHAPTHELLVHAAVPNGAGFNDTVYNTVVSPSAVQFLPKQNLVMLGIQNAAALGFTDANATTADTVLLNLATNTFTLVSRGTETAANTTPTFPATTGALATAPMGVSSGSTPRFVVFGTSDAAAFANGTTAFSDVRTDHGTISDLMVWDRTTGLLGLATHTLASGANMLTTTRLHTANYVGITANDKYLIWSTPYGQDVGGVSGSTYNGAIFVYTLPSASYAAGRTEGETRLINHAADITNYAGKVISNAGYSNLVLGNDGSTLYFTTNDVSQLGNGAIPFTDSAKTVSDLLAYNLDTGVLTLVSHAAGSSTVSSGAAVTWGGQSADGSVIYFSAADATPYGFTDSDTAKSDLIAYQVSTNTYSLVLPGATSTTLLNANETYVGTFGGHVYFTAENAVAMGAGADGNTAGKDLFRLESNGTYTLLSHATSTTTSTAATSIALSGNYQSNSLVVSEDGRYVAFTYTVPSGANGGFQFSIAGDILMVADTVNGAINVINHSGSSMLATGYQAWGGDTTKGFGDDGHSLVFVSSYLDWFNAGFSQSGQYDAAVMAYDLITGQQRLLSHSADPSNVVQASSANYVGMSPDGQWALFSAPDASKFGNNGVAFVDDYKSDLDLIAARVTTGEQRLLTGINGMSLGGGFNFQGFSDDANSVYLGLGQLDGYKTSHGSLSMPGNLVDSTATGSDLVSVRLNLLDLKTEADLAVAPGTTKAATDNLTTSAVLASVANELSAMLTPGQVADLYDGSNLVSSATANASGKAVWDLNNVSRGDHRYWLYDPAEAQQILLGNSLAASELLVKVL
jgi:microcompartment protein CcmL/EutN